MVEVGKYWFPLLVLVSALPGITLFIRGVVWGSDSFAFWAVSCGNNVYAYSLSSPQWFVSMLQQFVGCSLLNLALVIWGFYFLALLGLYFFVRKWFGVNSWRLPLYVGTITPLFFIEGLRFENDFFGWSLGFVVLGLFALFVEKRNPLMLFFSVVIACFSLFLWIPSVFIIAMCVFLLQLPSWAKYLIVSVSLLAILLPFLGYGVHSVTQGVGVNAVSEEIPLVGLVFILHVLHFYKHVPKPLFFYTVGLLFLGALKSKYMFLAVPLLMMGLLNKELDKGLSIPKLGIEKIPTLFFVGFFGLGWLVMGLFMYPISSDIQEMNQAIKLAEDQNIPLYNDWGDGWTFISLGYDTNYRASPPQPDWNNLPRPFIAYSKTEILDCNKVTKKIQKCN